MKRREEKSGGREEKRGREGERERASERGTKMWQIGGRREKEVTN